MSCNQSEYINRFNKENYKMYQFRVKKTDVNVLNHLNKIKNKNSYILSLINNDINNNVYTIKEIKTIIKPILNKYGIFEIYLFGSYARGEAYNPLWKYEKSFPRIKWFVPMQLPTFHRCF